MKVTTLRIPGTKTRPIRYATLVLVSPAPVIATLEIRDYKNDGDGVPLISRYAVREEPLDAGDRRFRLTKPGGGDRYYVCLPTGDEGFDTCECHSHAIDGRCKHSLALRELLDAGHIPEPSGVVD